MARIRFRACVGSVPRVERLSLLVTAIFAAVILRPVSAVIVVLVLSVNDLSFACVVFVRRLTTLEVAPLDLASMALMTLVRCIDLAWVTILLFEEFGRGALAATLCLVRSVVKSLVVVRVGLLRRETELGTCVLLITRVATGVVTFSVGQLGD